MHSIIVKASVIIIAKCFSHEDTMSFSFFSVLGFMFSGYFIPISSSCYFGGYVKNVRYLFSSEPYFLAEYWVNDNDYDSIKLQMLFVI